MRRFLRQTDLRPNAQRDVSDELRFHLEMRTQEFIEAGMSPTTPTRGGAGIRGRAFYRRRARAGRSARTHARSSRPIPRARSGRHVRRCARCEKRARSQLPRWRHWRSVSARRRRYSPW